MNRYAMKENILVIGAGSWGTAIAQTLGLHNHQVLIWDSNKSILEEIRTQHTNRRYHPELVLTGNIHVADSLEDACLSASIIILSIPTSFIPHYLETIVEICRPTPLIVNASKGLNHQNLQTLSMFVKKSLGKIVLDRYAVLSGPSFAKEVAEGKPSALSLACMNEDHLIRLAKAFHSNRFQIFPTDDIIGVEIGGALKNVIAITVGASDGLGYGYNARAALMTKGQEEISSIGKALGAKEATFWGLSGMGDLILTCTGDLSRNRQAGLKLAQGKSLRQILKELGQIAEGIRTTKSAYLLAKQLKIKAPILEETYQAIYQRKPITAAVESILDNI
jgi:glycerol-3-phosphate dehydrogenase (NAD(P)+)